MSAPLEERVKWQKAQLGNPNVAALPKKGGDDADAPKNGLQSSWRA